jgi:hypothetical protein
MQLADEAVVRLESSALCLPSYFVQFVEVATDDHDHVAVQLIGHGHCF